MNKEDKTDYEIMCCKKYKGVSDYDDDYIPYTAKRWTDIPKPFIIKEGNGYLTPEEEKLARKRTEELYKRLNIIKPDATLDDCKRDEKGCLIIDDSKLTEEFK